MNMTMWLDELTGNRLADDELDQARAKARKLYAGNRHIFEDELDALGALGVVSVVPLTFR